jgi:hypothetical protein
MILVCHVMSPVLLYVEVSLSAVRRLWAGAARLEHRVPTLVKQAQPPPTSWAFSQLHPSFAIGSCIVSSFAHSASLPPAYFTDISPNMADPRESSSYSVIPRIRYNTVGGVNGPLVILDNVRRHLSKLDSVRPV